MTTAGDLLSRAGVDLVAIGRELPNLDPGEVPVKPAPWWLRALWRDWVQGMATPSRIYVRSRWLGDATGAAALVTHELVHVSQWRRMGIVRFALRYLWGSLLGLVRYRSIRRAHSHLPIEQEAEAVAARILQHRTPR